MFKLTMAPMTLTERLYFVRSQDLNMGQYNYQKALYSGKHFNLPKSTEKKQARRGVYAPWITILCVLDNKDVYLWQEKLYDPKTERTGAVVKPRTLGREVPGSSPSVAVRCGLEQVTYPQLLR